MYSLPIHKQSIPYYQHTPLFPPRETSVIIYEFILRHRNHQNTIVYFSVHLLYCPFHGFDQMYGTNPSYGIKQNSFTAVKILYALPLYPLLPSSTPSNTDLFIVSTVLSFFRKSQVIIQYVELSDQLRSLSHMHLSFLHAFPWLNSSSIFSTEQYSIVQMCQSLFIHQLRNILAASKFYRL